MLASPAAVPAGPVRRTSQRQALRRPESRSLLSRAESQDAYASGGAGPGTAVDTKADQSKQYRDDSSEDEIPVPMKLSALTKALLNDPDDAPARGPSPPRTRRQASVLQTTARTGQAVEERRHLRSRSVQQESSRIEKEPGSEPSREQSPVRKRFIRLSRDSQGLGQLGPAPAKRRSTSTSRGARRESQQPPSRPSSRTESHEKPWEDRSEPRQNVNTPSQPQQRVVRIPSSSSVRRRIAARRSSGLNPDAPAVDGSGMDLGQDLPARKDELDNVARLASAVSSASKNSGSRYPSSSLRNRSDDNPNPHSSMRIKRVGKTPGGFLSGPARRGKRRQSDEEGGEEGVEGEQLFDSQERGSRFAEDGAPLSQVRQFNSGSPVSSNAAGRAVHRRQASQVELQSASKQPSPRGIDLPKKEDPLAAFEAGFPSPKGLNMPALAQSRDREPVDLRKPFRPELPSNHDQENEAPVIRRRSKPSVDLLMEKIPSRPLEADIPPVKGLPSPARKPLAAITKNTPSRAVPPPPPKMSVLETATSNAGAATTTQAKQRRNVLRVNGKIYTRLDCIGRGGSAKVYRVTAENGHMFALKRVSLENADDAVLRGFRGEIDLLTKLKGVERVINLFDHELNSEKKLLYLLMEMGELDLGSVLKARHALDESKFDPVFTRFYWKEMLECLQSVHQYAIVHSDLKPANFVLVQGRLKLIDFGIANAIADYTKNVHRDTQIGTPNYMSPESLLDSNSPSGNSGARMSGQPRLMKLGRPSDVWSLGCILYQMVYGTPPFGHIANAMARCQAIINPNHNVEYPLHAPCGTRIPNSVIKTMRSCLIRDQTHRPSVDQLLKEFDSFLYPRELPSDSLPVDREMLGRIVQDAVRKYVDGQEHPDPRKRPNREELRKEFSDDYWHSLKKAAVAKGVMW